MNITISSTNNQIIFNVFQELVRSGFDYDQPLAQIQLNQNIQDQFFDTFYKLQNDEQQSQRIDQQQNYNQNIANFQVSRNIIPNLNYNQSGQMNDMSNSGFPFNDFLFQNFSNQMNNNQQNEQKDYSEQDSQQEEENNIFQYSTNSQRKNNISVHQSLLNDNSISFEQREEASILNQTFDQKQTLEPKLYGSNVFDISYQSSVQKYRDKIEIIQNDLSQMSLDFFDLNSKQDMSIICDKQKSDEFKLSNKSKSKQQYIDSQFKHLIEQRMYQKKLLRIHSKKSTRNVKNLNVVEIQKQYQYLLLAQFDYYETLYLCYNYLYHKDLKYFNNNNNNIFYNNPTISQTIPPPEKVLDYNSNNLTEKIPTQPQKNNLTKKTPTQPKEKQNKSIQTKKVLDSNSNNLNKNIPTQPKKKQNKSIQTLSNNPTVFKSNAPSQKILDSNSNNYFINFPSLPKEKQNKQTQTLSNDPIVCITNAPQQKVLDYNSNNLTKKIPTQPQKNNLTKKTPTQPKQKQNKSIQTQKVLDSNSNNLNKNTPAQPKKKQNKQTQPLSNDPTVCKSKAPPQKVLDSNSNNLIKNIPTQPKKKQNKQTQTLSNDPIVCKCNAPPQKVLDSNSNNLAKNIPTQSKEKQNKTSQISVNVNIIWIEKL